MKYFVFFIILLIATPGFSQRKKSKPKNSYARGTLFGYWGYNRSFYSESNIRFVGNGYDFVMKDAKAYDNPSREASTYFNPKTITVPQFNGRIGYYFKDHWAVSFGYDHMKYIFADNNHVKISGNIGAGIDTVTNLSGNYDAYDFVTNRNTFHYENSNGLNYLRFEFTRTDQWYKTRKNGWFALSTNLGIGAGGLLSFNDFTFAGRKDMVTISLSGYAVSAHAGVRFEFFKHLFLQANLSGGMMHQLRVKTRPNDPSAYARQFYGYGEFDTVIGFLFYIRPTNDCNSCPHW